MKKNLANIITCLRILGSVALLFFPVFSVAFYIPYLFCGFSDMIDGPIARKTNASSKLGSQFDTLADIVFLALSMIKVLPAIQIPKWLWIWSGLLAMFKISNIILGYIYRKRFISLHTVMNKVTGLLLFLLPLTIAYFQWKYIAVIICAIATFSAIQEGVYVIVGSECG